jgi:hypothetical protein
MNPVELPDYSSVIGIAIGALSIAAIALSLTRHKKDSKLLYFLSFKWWKDDRVLPSEDYAARKMEERIKGMYKGRIAGKHKHKPQEFYADTTWEHLPHLKESWALCGFTSPGLWECCCGKRVCETYKNLCDSIAAGTHETPTPTPDRKAAIAHTKGKS